jgi:hypothetical protein
MCYCVTSGELSLTNYHTPSRVMQIKSGRAFTYTKMHLCYMYKPIKI